MIITDSIVGIAHPRSVNSRASDGLHQGSFSEQIQLPIPTVREGR